MKRFFLLLGLVCICTLISAENKVAPATSDNGPLSVKQVTLSNGLQVWINEDHSQPVVFGALVVKAGGKDCPDTGLAHYLEHLLFKGTTELGTVDYQAEKVWLDSIAACYEKLSTLSAEKERLEIQKEINRLSIKAADYAIPNEFDRLTAQFGGTGLNAATSYDYTFYFNSFSPQYLPQWAELNSHRMLNPVFRLFQGELETVYEEKNRSADNTMQAPLFEMIREFSGGNPYSYEVIGSTANLKNPRLGQMMDFFKTYYVACNMGLILSGDIDSEGAIPLLESTFGRLPKGEKPAKAAVSAPALNGRKDVKIKAEIPMIKIAVYAFNGPTDKDEDAPALDIATGLLSNSFSSGLLDSLMTEHKMLLGGAARVPLFNEMGIVGYAIVPSLPFGSLPKAEKLCREQVEKIKNGRFSDEEVEALKKEAGRNALVGLETIASRSEQMVTVMGQDRTWDEYLVSVDRIASVTRDDVIRVANKYFNDNYIRFEKVKGKYPKDTVSKPDFDPIIPKNSGAKSEYAKKLESMQAADVPVRLVDFEKDVQRLKITEGVTLVYKENPVNDLFNLSVRVSKGTVEDPAIEQVASYLGTVGTDSLSLQQLSRAWQTLGTNFSVTSGSHAFELEMLGYDSALEPSLKLLRHFIDHVKIDAKSFSELKTNVTMGRKTFFTGGTSSIMSGMMQRVFYGEDSPLLKQLNVKELNQLGAQGLLDRFAELMNNEYTVFYSGTLPAETVAKAIVSELDLSRATGKIDNKFVNAKVYEEPTVFLYNLPGSRQTQILSYQTPQYPDNDADKAKMKLLGDYLGGGMYSLMFQEVREFRALAYSAGGNVNIPAPAYKAKNAIIYTMLGTQADKAESALALVDSLLRTIPVREAGVASSKRSIVAEANNTYPSFRKIGSYIIDEELLGYTEDPSAPVIASIESISAEDLQSFAQGVISSAPVSYVVVGDKKTLPMEKLQSLGRIVELKADDIYKK